MDRNEFRQQVMSGIEKKIELDKRCQADGKKYFLDNIKVFEKEVLDGHFPEDFDLTEDILNFIKNRFIKSEGRHFTVGGREYYKKWVLNPHITEKVIVEKHPNKIKALLGFKKSSIVRDEEYYDLDLLYNISGKEKSLNYFYALTLYLYENFGIVVSFLAKSYGYKTRNEEARYIDRQVVRCDDDENKFKLKNPFTNMDTLYFSIEPPFEINRD